MLEHVAWRSRGTSVSRWQVYLGQFDASFTSIPKSASNAEIANRLIQREPQGLFKPVDGARFPACTISCTAPAHVLFRLENGPERAHSS